MNNKYAPNNNQHKIYQYFLFSWYYQVKGQGKCKLIRLGNTFAFWSLNLYIPELPYPKCPAYICSMWDY